jgi:hypothetical protein
MAVDGLIDDASPDHDGTAAVMQTASAFMASKHLFVAGELGLFQHLANGPLDLAALAAKAGAPARTIRIIADAVVSLGFIERQGAHYRNTPVAQALLTGQGSRDLRPLLRMFDRITYPSWMDLIRSVRTGQPTRAALDTENQRVLSEGVEAITRPAADALPHRLLMAGTFLIGFGEGDVYSGEIRVWYGRPSASARFWIASRSLLERRIFSRRSLRNVAFA